MPPALRAERYCSHTPDAFARTWVRNVDAEALRYPASDVYGGVAVTSAAKAADNLGCRLYFVSAGMSLVRETKRIPGYDLTVSHGSASAPTPLRSGRASAGDWWLALNKAYGADNPFLRATRANDGLVLIALPRIYLGMVEPSLLALPASHRRRLRLLTTNASWLSADLQSQAIAYDARLDHLADGPKGTQSSAAQRALLHFSSMLAGRPSTVRIETQRRWVNDALKTATVSARPLRIAQSDAHVAKWIRRQDPQRQLAQTALLRAFRASGYACEQGRFRRIAESIEARPQ